MKGRVYKSTGSWYQAKGEDGKFYALRLRGAFKQDGITSTNPIAVGDLVDFELEADSSSNGIIQKIHPRDNYVNRQSPRIKSQQHIVASNLDQSLLIATLREPRTSQGFIDRFLVTCEMYHIPAIIYFNKIDVYREKDLALLDHFREMYENIGYRVISGSLKNGEMDGDAAALLKDRTTLISGHSGVGKSSFINMLMPGRQLKTQDVSGWSGKGQHTTTFAEMFDLAEGGSIIDTPGMKEFGLVGVERAELSGYFPEMKEVLQNCQFNNCLHINEPGCAIKQGVIDGEIDEDRYVNYVNMLESIEEQRY